MTSNRQSAEMTETGQLTARFSEVGECDGRELRHARQDGPSRRNAPLPYRMDIPLEHLPVRVATYGQGDRPTIGEIAITDGTDASWKPCSRPMHPWAHLLGFMFISLPVPIPPRTTPEFNFTSPVDQCANAAGSVVSCEDDIGRWILAIIAVSNDILKTATSLEETVSAGRDSWAHSHALSLSMIARPIRDRSPALTASHVGAVVCCVFGVDTLLPPFPGILRQVVLPASSKQETGRPETMADWFGLSQPFDAHYRLVTSGFLPPFWLFVIRLLFAVYSLTTNIVYLILYLDVEHSPISR